MTAADYAVLVGYLVGISLVGLLASRKAKASLDEFFLAGRSIPWLAAAASLIATGISCKSLIGLPGLSFTGDMRYLQMYLPVPFAVWIASRVFLPFYSRLRITSVYEYLGFRFSPGVRSFASVLFQIETVLVAGTVIAAPALVLSEVTGISYHVAVILLLFLTLAYTVAGGTKAVVWTDVAQLAVFVGVPVAVIVVVVVGTDGGLPRLVQVAAGQGKLRLFDFSFGSGAEVTFWSAIFSMTCWHLANFSISQVIMQRYMTAPSERDCRRTLLTGGTGILIMWAGLMAIGAILYAYATLHPGVIAADTTADRVFPAFVFAALPAGFKGLFIAAAFAAGMSTLSSMLNSMGTVTLLDVWKLHWDDGAPETTWIRRARILTVTWGVAAFAAAFVVLKFGTVVTAGIKLGTVIIGAVFGVFVLGIFSRRATSVGVVVGALAGMATLVVLILTTSVSWTWYCLIGSAVTCAVGFACSLPGKPREDAALYTYAGLAEERRSLPPLPAELSPQHTP